MAPWPIDMMKTPDLDCETLAERLASGQRKHVEAHRRRKNMPAAAELFGVMTDSCRQTWRDGAIDARPTAARVKEEEEEEKETPRTTWYAGRRLGTKPWMATCPARRSASVAICSVVAAARPTFLLAHAPAARHPVHHEGENPDAASAIMILAPGFHEMAPMLFRAACRVIVAACRWCADMSSADIEKHDLSALSAEDSADAQRVMVTTPLFPRDSLNVIKHMRC